VEQVDLDTVALNKKIIILLGLMLSLRALAMTVEQEQRFLYYYYEAERLWQAEQYKDAYDLFSFCYALRPNDAMTNRYLGHIYRGMKHVDQSLAYYQCAWENAPEECWKDYAITLYNTGEADNKDKAVQVMEATCNITAKNADLWEHLRDAYLGVQSYKKALAAQDQVDKIEGYDAYSAINRYRIYLFMQKPKKAVEAIEQYLKEDPKNLQFLYYRMQLYESMGAKPKQLIPIYQDILQLDPFSAMVLNNYAYLLATNKGDLKQAEKMSAKAVQAEPNNATYLDTYAWILHLTGQNELAKLYIRQAINQLQDKDIPQEIQQHYTIIIQQ